MWFQKKAIFSLNGGSDMEVKFYRCLMCKRLDEERNLLKSGQCICGNRRFGPTYATVLELILFVLCNPTYLLKALKGD